MKKERKREKGNKQCHGNENTQLQGHKNAWLQSRDSYSHENTLLQSQAKKNSTAFKNCSTGHKSQKLSKCFPNQAKQQSFVHSKFKKKKLNYKKGGKRQKLCKFYIHRRPAIHSNPNSIHKQVAHGVYHSHTQ